jgi:hypothetical protein
MYTERENVGPVLSTRNVLLSVTVKNVICRRVYFADSDVEKYRACKSHLF